MRYKGHLITTFAIALPIMEVTNDINAIALTGLALGALLPDIDEPNSYIGRRIPIIPTVFKKVFGHRGMTHSLLAVSLMILIAFFTDCLFFEMIACGYFLHIFEDTFSVSGIKWLLPFSDKPIAFKIYSTGKKSEIIVVSLMFLLLITEVLLFI
ncbi:metal-dependent hydrolase [Listeria ilorinensis]|uniref:metal-dependent hydrolase n=1 Tax=Listeria ilorinensis TaxID=2867439 RepID=UPI001EF42517|nr:metal-dependent hydrolase [Listeria ilorinensis]